MKSTGQGGRQRFDGPRCREAVQTFEAKAATLLAQADAHRALSSSLAYGDC